MKLEVNKKAIKKFGIITLGTAIATAPIGLLIGLNSSNNSSGKNVSKITGQGSSSVIPLISAITRETKYDVQYQANGSGEGLKSQSGASPLTPFGMTSSLKVPSTADKVNWEKNNIRTATWAIDAISISLNLPNDIQYPKDIRPEIDIQELSKLYDKEGGVTTTTWADLLLNENKASGSKTSLSSAPTPLGRTGGKATSGTADGFWHTLSKNMAAGSTADEDHTTLSAAQQTPEANSQALNILKSKENSLTYLSLGYAVANEDDNSRVPVIKAKDGSMWEPKIENVQSDTYKWRRPFNILYSTDNKDAVEFANFLLSKEVQTLVEKEGFVKLTNAQKAQQYPFDASDFEIDNLLSGSKMGLSI